MRYKISFFLFFFVFCLYVHCPDTWANVTIGPNQLNFITKPGRESTKIVKVENHSDQVYTVDVVISDALQDKGNMKYVYPGETSYSCAAWTNVTPEKITLEGHQTKEMTIKIKPDPGVKGSFHGAVIFAITPVVESGGEYQVMGRIGAVVLTSVFIEGTLKPNVEARDAAFTMATPIRNVSMGMSSQPTAILNLENTGNCMVNLQGEVVIRHAETKRRIASGSILSINYASPPTIPPGIKRPLLIPLDKSIPNGEYILATKITYGRRSRLSTSVPLVVGDGKTDAGEGENEKIQLGFIPQRLDMRLRPGAKRSSAISIINFEKSNIRLTSDIFPLTLTSDGLPQIGAQHPGLPSIDNYFEIKFTTDEIAGGQKGRMVFMVKMPKDTESPGLAVVRLKAETTDGDEKRESMLYFPLLVSLAESEPASLAVYDIDYFPAFNEQSPDRIVLTVENTSDNYGFIKGMIEVREEAGYVYGSQFYGNEETMLILPGGKREVEILLNPKERLKPGKDYLLNLQADIYDESIVRKRKIIKILDKCDRTATFTLEEDETGKLAVVIKKEEAQESQEEQVASSLKE